MWALLAWTLVFGLLPFAVGAVAGFYLYRYRLVLLTITAVPVGYFAVDYGVALRRGGLDETLVLGISLGHSPVYLMFLTAVTVGPALGIAAGSWWRTR